MARLLHVHTPSMGLPYSLLFAALLIVLTIDNIIGILYTKDMLKQLRDGHNQQSIRGLVRPAYFVPETKKLDDLLREIRQRRTHLAIVIDEYGSVAGLATIEDLMEEIVGDIRDEYDIEENLYEQVSSDEFIVDAKMSVGEFDDLLDTKLEDADYDTLGGFLFAKLDKIPVAGDTLSHNDLTFTILSTRGRRITKVRVERAHQQEPSQPIRLLPNPTMNASNEGTKSENRPISAEERSHIEYRGA